MKVLLDLNVVLDVILNRLPWIADSLQVWNAQQSGQFDGYLAATELTNLSYIVGRTAEKATAKNAVGICLNSFRIVPVDHAVLVAANAMAGNDFEDNVCSACADVVAADWIVTRDKSGFEHSNVPAISPSDLLLKIAAGENELAATLNFYLAVGLHCTKTRWPVKRMYSVHPARPRFTLGERWRK